METKFSAGPWEISHEGRQNKTWRIRSVPSPYTAVATVHARIDKEANAHLIAAAPDMYDALAEVVRKFDAASSAVVKNTPLGIMKARVALAKARGEGL